VNSAPFCQLCEPPVNEIIREEMVAYRAGPGKCMSRRGGLDLNRSDFPRLLSKSCPCGKSADLRAAAAKQKNEKDHKAFLAKALGSSTPTGLKFTIPASVVKTGQSLLNTGVALETAFVEAYLGASETFSSQELRTIAAKVAANEASHFSFFDAAAGGHGTLPSLPASDTIPNTVKKLKPFLA